MNWWTSILLIILVLVFLYYMFDDFSFDSLSNTKDRCNKFCPYGGVLRYDDTNKRFFCVV